jgi:VanZ family protein
VIQLLNAHLPWLLMMMIISFQSSMSNIRLPDLGIQFIDKIMHLTVFGVLGWLIARGMYKSNITIVNRYFMLFTLLVGGLFGLIDEWHQYTVPGRRADITDWLADLTGIMLFGLYYKWKIART